MCLDVDAVEAFAKKRADSDYGPINKNEIKDSTMRIVPHLLGAAIAAALISTPVFAAELTGTLKKIKESGTITLGHRDASIPFSYIADASGVPMGYSHDIQLKIVEAIKKDLDMPDLKVKYNLVTSQTRIPLVQNGTVDVECGSTTNNVERQQQVDFSVGIFEVGTRLLSKKDSSYKDFDDLKGKNVVTTAGTTSERILKAMNADKQMGMNVISAKDHGESFQMLESGRAVAFMMDDALLAGEMAKAKKPDDWAVTGTAQSYEIYGCMVRKGDAPFKKAVDDAIVATFKSGEINNIYSKWFMSPVPPKGLNLNFQMSDEFKKLIGNPTDKAADDKAADDKANDKKA
ncbi:L-aspartate-binding protein / L-glutamate-binding protein [Pseudomonas syringae]|nr:L-aspartate-binding protein / L-glutamate-binding protein [Pseudomonas syringae]